MGTTTSSQISPPPTTATMMRRAVFSIARSTPCRVPLAARPFSIVAQRRSAAKTPASGEVNTGVKKFEDVKTEADLIPEGAPVGTVPTDLNQATGLERLEVLGKIRVLTSST